LDLWGKANQCWDRDVKGRQHDVLENPSDSCDVKLSNPETALWVE